jgi:hypothetical protein
MKNLQISFKDSKLELDVLLQKTEVHNTGTYTTYISSSNNFPPTFCDYISFLAWILQVTD